jgi:hypothetical protein
VADRHIGIAGYKGLERELLLAADEARVDRGIVVESMFVGSMPVSA